MQDIVNKIAATGKGILAADESTPTLTRRFESVGVEPTFENRHYYRHALFSATGIEKYISGVILFDETIKNEETIAPLRGKVAIGIKVDKGAKDYYSFGANEKLTEGLDGLDDRLKEYKDLGVEFAKWRAVLNVGSPMGSVIANAYVMARYAKKCQLAGIVPIVEPEILMEGSHSIYKTFEVTGKVLRYVFEALYYEKVVLEHMILKPNMVLSGYQNHTAHCDDVADMTIRCFRRVVPAAVPMIAFLSGGQPDGNAVRNLNAMNQENTELHSPWYMSFSFGRELQQNALSKWASGNEQGAKEALIKRAEECSLAAWGELSEEALRRLG
jgi:fructose-bisphosphate aldolase class I